MKYVHMKKKREKGGKWKLGCCVYIVGDGRCTGHRTGTLDLDRLPSFGMMQILPASEVMAVTSGMGATISSFHLISSIEYTAGTRYVPSQLRNTWALLPEFIVNPGMYCTTLRKYLDL